jgi:head-tail adaptor
MKNMHHQVDVMEPATSPDDFNQPAGVDTVYLPKVPCSIEPLNTRELEQARQLQADATHKVCFYGDPSKPIKHGQYLRFGSRQLHIASALDLKMNGEQWELLVGERVA